MNLNNQPRGLDIQLLEPTRIILFFSVRIFLYFPAFAPTSATTTSTTVLLFMGGGSPIYCKHSHYDGAVPGGGLLICMLFSCAFSTTADTTVPTPAPTATIFSRVFLTTSTSTSRILVSCLYFYYCTRNHYSSCCSARFAFFVLPA